MKSDQSETDLCAETKIYFAKRMAKHISEQYARLLSMKPELLPHYKTVV